MSFKSLIASRAIQLFLDEGRLLKKRRKRRLKEQQRDTPRNLQLFYRVDDPYSYLLMQCLPTLLEHPGLQLTPRAIAPPDKTATPEPERLQHFSLSDANILARTHQLEFPPDASLPNTRQSQLGHQILLRAEDQPDFVSTALQTMKAFWDKDLPALEKIAHDKGSLPKGDAQQRLSKHQKLQTLQGHYLPATIYDGIEWFWGVDRLPELQERLEQDGLGGAPALPAKRIPHQLEANNVTRDETGRILVEFFFSFRSPYSYIAAQKVWDWEDRYPVRVIMRPVLPMVMRGLPVPLSKRLYIVKDSYRLARRQGLPFGRIADPLGVGVERAFGVWLYAREAGKEKEFVQAASRACWAQGIDLATDRGMHAVVKEAGLQWHLAKIRLKDHRWRDEAELNRRELLDHNLWGVPCFRVGDFFTWGQDRMQIVEALLQTLTTQTP